MIDKKARGKHPPKRCPECGSTNINYVDLATERGNLVYDTYCYDCDWSGDISPDSDLDFPSPKMIFRWKAFLAFLITVAVTWGILVFVL